MCPARILLPLLLTVHAVILATTCAAQDTLHPDTTQSAHPEKVILVEARVGLFQQEPTVALQAGYRWFKFLSTDLLGRTRPFTVHAGVTFSPLEFIFLQGSIGYGNYMDESLHGPIYDPDIYLGLRAGIRIPVTRRAAIVVSSGTLWSVDQHFCYTCGYLHATTEEYRVEQRGDNIMELGLGILL